ncbi:MAG: hypothetical protein LBI17_03960 [Rickettsiales bacterium]|jgi:hypothetical protein|nr:hypothetical protein [Rickettsiales bacterium]
MKLILFDELGYNSPEHVALRDEEARKYFGGEEGRKEMLARNPNDFRDQDGMKLHKVELDSPIAYPKSYRKHPKNKKVAAEWKKMVEEIRNITRQPFDGALEESVKNGDNISGMDVILTNEPKKSLKDEIHGMSFWLLMAASDYNLHIRANRSCAGGLVVHDAAGIASGRPIQRKYFSKNMRILVTRLLTDGNLKALSSRFDSKSGQLHVYEHAEADYEFRDGDIVHVAKSQQR